MKMAYIVLGIVVVAGAAYYFIVNLSLNNQLPMNNTINQGGSNFAPNEYLVGFILGASDEEIVEWAKTNKITMVNKLMGESGENGSIWQIYSPNDKRPPEGGIVKYIERNAPVRALGS